MTRNNFRHLLSEGKIGGMTVRNRLVLPAMVTNFADPTGNVNARLISYHVRRAKGGVGLIIVEGAYVSKEGQGFTCEVGIYSDVLIPCLTTLVKAVKKHGAKIAIQLLHAGRQTSSDTTGLPIVAPSPIPCPVVAEVPQVLSLDRISAIVNQFAQAARRAKEAGFDAIEVHGAHGYLIHQFLSPLTNKRTDSYGGSKKNRLRFAVDILEAIRSAVGSHYPIIFRISAKEFLEGGIDLDLSTIYCKELSHRVDCLHVSAGCYGARQWIVQPYSHNPGLLVPLATHIKKSVKIPIITVGRIHSPEFAEEILSKGDADFIAMGRALLADPDLPLKIRDDCIGDILPCLSCYTGCSDRLRLGLDISCLVNPRLGRESVEPPQNKRKSTCVVCGGGPAGLSAALTMAKRGARVLLLENEALGGQFLLAARIPFKADFKKLIERYVAQLKNLGAEIIHETAALDLIKQLEPDHIVLATGSVPILPSIPGLGTKKHMTYIEAIKYGVQEHSVLIVGGGSTGCELAELLLTQGKIVTIVEMEANLARDMGNMAPILLDRLAQLKPTVFNNSQVAEIQKDGVFLRKKGSAQVELRGVECVILACGVRPDKTLEKDLRAAEMAFVSIGDCRKPRNGFWAIREGFETAMYLF